ncbi:hypothetical protein GH714_029748 [Hevea brasiliensis]|uniref:Uncharacterized protein n=1 Tax=Hevea brasiliensis TaxID=3981 RepID=A0A6A6L0U6_HEVBR|nr:hypothetical protein GH714_029748 [Hevea brasiliensis]
MRRRAVAFFPQRRFFSSTSENPTLYSFLQPSVFALKKSPAASTVPTGTSPDPPIPTPRTLSLDCINTLESTIHKSVLTGDTDVAWKSFKSLTANSAFPSKPLTNSLITHLSSPGDTLNLKRAFAAVVYVMEKNPELLDFETVQMVLSSMKCANCCSCFCFSQVVFEESCRIAIDEKLDFMKPDLVACNVALECCCRKLESVTDAENVIETMSVLVIRPDEWSFGFLGYLYALKGLKDKINELKGLMDGFCFSNKRLFYSNLIIGYVKSGNLDSVSTTVLYILREEDVENLDFTTIVIDKSFGFGIINACVNLGLSDKAHSILDEMNAQGGSVGLGVYVPVLKAYCKENRTAEATQLVMEISNSGLQLDEGSYDALIEASMTSQDFQSAFTLFRDMREARIPDLKGSYLTIMTGLMESHRPELMAAFLDEVVEDPRVEVKTHDWNSIIHAFCKAGRLEDAKRTFRRMIFLQFEPNDQTYLSLINGYVTAEKYFSVLMLWNEVKRKVSNDKEKGIKFDQNLVDAFLYALVKGGFFDAVMQVLEKSQEMKIFVDKWKYKQAFMETHKKLKMSKLRKRSFRKMEALIAFKNWVGLNA